MWEQLKILSAQGPRRSVIARLSLDNARPPSPENTPTQASRRFQASPQTRRPPFTLLSAPLLLNTGFARTLTSAWGVCLLDLFLRVQLNILGSHLYLSSALQAGQPQERRRELSQASQARSLRAAPRSARRRQQA